MNIPINTTQISGSTGPAQEPSDLNAYMVIMMSMLNSIDAQQDGIQSTIIKENLLKTEFDKQRAAVAAAEAELNKRINKQIDPTDSDAVHQNMREIQEQLAIVQSEQSKLSFVQNKIVRGFKQFVEPAQFMIQSDSIMFGGALHSYQLTQKTK
jgi:hypothetical protein